MLRRTSRAFLLALGAAVLLAGCAKPSHQSDVQLEPHASPASSDVHGAIASTTRAYTPTDRLVPPAAGTEPQLNATRAYDALIAAQRVPTSDGSGPQEALLGLFTHDEGGPSNVLSWGFVFTGVATPNLGMGGLPPVVQNALVVVDATTGSVIMEIRGVK